MALNLENLDDITRKYMIDEVRLDIESNSVYKSKFLTEEGIKAWDRLLLEAVQFHDSSWLAGKLRDEHFANSIIVTKDRNGHFRRVRFNPENLSDSEFNRYYIRGVCLRAIEEGKNHVVTYRAKQVMRPISPEGLQFDPRLLLEDLRNNKGQTDNDVPSNPNSGISVRLPN